LSEIQIKAPLKLVYQCKTGQEFDIVRETDTLTIGGSGRSAAGAEKENDE
jgi:hypothetical protein